MLCGTGLGRDPAGPRSPHHRRHLQLPLLNRANQDKRLTARQPLAGLLPDVTAGVGAATPCRA